jgi:hypothetical protein
MPTRPARFLVSPDTSECDRVKIMVDLVKDGTNDPAVQALARTVYARAQALAAQSPVRTGDWFARILAMEALRAAQTPQYIDNDGDQEWMQQASYTMANGGECKAMSVLFVALCTILGLNAQIVWITQTGKMLNHVTAIVYLDGKWMWADASIRGAMLGESPYHAVDRLGAYNVVGGDIRPSGQAAGKAGGGHGGGGGQGGQSGQGGGGGGWHNGAPVSNHGGGWHGYYGGYGAYAPWQWDGWTDLWYGWPEWWWDLNYPYLYAPYETVYAQPGLLAGQSAT